MNRGDDGEYLILRTCAKRNVGCLVSLIKKNKLKKEFLTSKTMLCCSQLSSDRKKLISLELDYVDDEESMMSDEVEEEIETTIETSATVIDQLGGQLVIG